MIKLNIKELGIKNWGIFKSTCIIMKLKCIDVKNIKMKKIKICCLLIIPILISNHSFGQYNPLGVENSKLAMDRQTGFIVMTSAALSSYLISQFLVNDPKLDFYQAHIGYYNGKSGTGGSPMMDQLQTTDETTTTTSEQTDYNILMENFGVEREFTKWFSLRLEANVQQCFNSDYFTVGGGIKTYYKWTILRKKKIHPFIEYGAGVFLAAKKFPEDGSTGTFNLNYAIGGEYILPNNDKIMVDFNFKHHSNNNLGDSNPGFDSNGVSISYCWARDKKAKK
jgi:hypothetical protein